MIEIHFIINPIAGNGNNYIIEPKINEKFEKDTYKIIVKYTEYKKHASILSKNSISEGADIIVACGGDGTINEVASNLLNTNVKFGIIPLGSGNGLASNMNIPKNIDKAIRVLKLGKATKIDVGKINDYLFFSNTGLGFDANVIENYELSHRRKLSSYIKAILKSFKEFKYENSVSVEVNNNSYITEPFMLFISNSNELGYNFSLTPKASLQDGYLDLLLVTKMSKVKLFCFMLLTILKKHHLLNEVSTFQTKEIKLNRFFNDEIKFQIDGELLKIKDKNISISILEEALTIIS